MRSPACTLCCLLLAGAALANDDAFVGDWDLTLKEGRNTLEGRLKIRETDSGLKAHVEGGPVRLSIDGETIEMGVDDRTATGMPFERYLHGTLVAGEISGHYGPEDEVPPDVRELCEKLPLACPAPTGTWQAVPHVPRVSDTEAGPVDLSGRWVMATPGLRRWTADLTAGARAWKAGFDVRTDLPGQRCLSAGLVNGWGFRGNDPEIFQSAKKITMILGAEVRRIYLDDRRPPEYTDWYPLGFSSGQWQGDTLVVETTHLQPGVREWMGDPVSENARVVETYRIDENSLLVGVMTLYDEQNYHEPPVKRARWRRADDEQIVFPSLCDPDSFYRELYDEGLFDAYIERQERRF